MGPRSSHGMSANGRPTPAHFAAFGFAVRGTIGPLAYLGSWRPRVQGRAELVGTSFGDRLTSHVLDRVTMILGYHRSSNGRSARVTLTAWGARPNDAEDTTHVALEHHLEDATQRDVAADDVPTAAADQTRLTDLAITELLMAVQDSPRERALEGFEQEVHASSVEHRPRRRAG